MEYTTFYLPDGLWSIKMSKIMLSNDFSDELDDSWSESLFESAISAGVHSCAKYSVCFQQLLAQFKIDTMSNYEIQSQFARLIDLK